MSRPKEPIHIHVDLGDNSEADLKYFRTQISIAERTAASLRKQAGSYRDFENRKEEAWMVAMLREGASQWEQHASYLRTAIREIQEQLEDTDE